MNLKNWTAYDIKHALEKAGHNQAEVARACDVSPAWVHAVIFHGEVSDKVRRRIAEFIGVDVKEIWPEYYLRDSLAA
jgi:lambda repressor-like predicted transcriptional regulator